MYGGMQASNLKRTKEMEQELSRLKRMYADLVMANNALKTRSKRKFEVAGEARRRHVPHRQAPPFCAAKLSLPGTVSGGL
jgi:hypothetical protein